MHCKRETVHRNPIQINITQNPRPGPNENPGWDGRENLNAILARFLSQNWHTFSFASLFGEGLIGLGVKKRLSIDPLLINDYQIY